MKTAIPTQTEETIKNNIKLKFPFITFKPFKLFAKSSAEFPEAPLLLEFPELPLEDDELDLFLDFEESFELLEFLEDTSEESSLKTVNV